MRHRISSALPVLAAIASIAAVGGAAAQERVNGAIQQHGFLQQSISPDEIKVFHGGEFKGAHKVAISVFDVAFPNENHFTASTHGHQVLGRAFSNASASMSTTLSGVDRATQQRITDKAYQLFVEQLRGAGYEVVDQAELTRLAPEFATWSALPNFTPGRFGAYVAPTGQALRLLPGDAAKRDTSGMLGQQMTPFRALDMPQAFARSPYIAHDGAIGVIAVTLVVDYGVYSSSGESHKLGGGASAGFLPGVSIAAGDVVDHGSLLDYWGPKSGGFPANAFLQQPIRSDRPFGVVNGENGSGHHDVVADPKLFEAAADEVVALAVPKLVSVMAAAR
jgi:hypothetical protein